MLCENYSRLNPVERIQLIGKLVHAVQNDNFFFDEAVNIIDSAEKSGLFENVKINPSNEEGNSDSAIEAA